MLMTPSSRRRFTACLAVPIVTAISRRFPTIPLPPSRLRDLPCRSADCLRPRRSRQGRCGRQHQRGEMPGLPRQRARTSAWERSRIEGCTRQYPADLRHVPRPEIRNGLQRREFRPLYVLPGKRPRQGGSRRFGNGGSLHRLPRPARHSGRRRSEVAHQQVQRSHHLRQVPRQRQARIRAEHSRAGDRARQLAGASLHRLPRHSHYQGAERSQVRGGLRQCAEHLRLLPRQRETLGRIRRGWQPRQLLPG